MDWQVTARRDNVINITLRQVYLMSIFLIKSTTFLSICYLVVLTKLDESRLRPNSLLKLWSDSQSYIIDGEKFFSAVWQFSKHREGLPENRRLIKFDEIVV